MVGISIRDALYRIMNVTIVQHTWELHKAFILHYKHGDNVLCHLKNIYSGVYNTWWMHCNAFWYIMVSIMHYKMGLQRKCWPAFIDQTTALILRDVVWRSLTRWKTEMLVHGEEQGTILRAARLLCAVIGQVWGGWEGAPLLWQDKP